MKHFPESIVMLSEMRNKTSLLHPVWAHWEQRCSLAVAARGFTPQKEAPKSQHLQWESIEKHLLVSLAQFSHIFSSHGTQLLGGFPWEERHWPSTGLRDRGLILRRWQSSSQGNQEREGGNHIKNGDGHCFLSHTCSSRGNSLTHRAFKIWSYIYKCLACS